MNATVVLMPDGGPSHFSRTMWFLIKEFARLQGLADECGTITQSNRLLDVARNDSPWIPVAPRRALCISIGQILEPGSA